MTDTIFALSSGVGRAAIAVIRISGPGALGALRALAGRVPEARHAKLMVLRRQSGDVLDRALVLFFQGPRSDTGEDIVELHLHGSRAVVRAVLEELGGMTGLRPAEPGEFARRALHNGKKDLLDVEALADLIDADTELQRCQALSGGGSLLRGRVEAWRRIILDIRADLEAGIDFSDEGDVVEQLDSQAEQNLRNLLSNMTSALGEARRGERIREGFVVALCGPPNAGKSSLLNALARRDVAIVSPIAGTTRDLIEVALELDGVPVRLVDTAGVRESADPIEQEGVRRALQVAETADLSIWLSPGDDPVSPPETFSGVVVGTKADLRLPQGVGLQVSVVTGQGIAELLEHVHHFSADGLTGESVLLTRVRHVSAVSEASKHLEDALAASSQPEICAESLRLAAKRMEQLLGRVDVEDVLGEVFSRFCVGK